MMAVTASDEENMTSRQVLHGRTLVSLRDIFRTRQVRIEPNKPVKDLQTFRSPETIQQQVLS